MKAERILAIPQMWHLLRELRRVVEEMLVDFPKDVRDATAMVASELVSNAIKYGESVPTAESASVRLSLFDNKIQIAVSSGASTESSAKSLLDRINQIAAADSKEELYMNRLQQLLDDPAEKGGLGLYRIGFEGQFDLTNTYADQVLVVIATRGLP